MPSRWGGRVLALVAALFLGAAGFVAGRFAGQKLAFGFTWDWYALVPQRAYTQGLVVGVAALAAALSALLAAALATAGAHHLARWRMRANAYAPPRYSRPLAYDRHAARLAAGLPLAAALLVALVIWAFLAVEGIARVTPAGYAALVADAAAFGAGATALVAGWSTFFGFVQGRLVRNPARNGVSRVAIFGARHPKTVVSLVVLVSLLAGYFATSVTTGTEVADALPRGDPATLAYDNLTARFPSGFTQQVTFHFRALDVNDTTQRLIYEQANASLKSRQTPAAPWNITDEVYVRAEAEYAARVVNASPFGGSIGEPEMFKLLNWTLAGGDSTGPCVSPTAPCASIPGQVSGQGNASFDLPDTSPQGEARYCMLQSMLTGACQGVQTNLQVPAVYAALDAVVSPDWRQSALLVTVDPAKHVRGADVGEAAMGVRSRLLAEAPTSPDPLAQVFGPANPPLFTADRAITDAHASDLARHDYRVLLPIIAVFALLTLAFALRGFAPVLAAAAPLAFAILWTLGLVGFVGAPLDTVDLALVPLILGVGLAFALLLINEHQAMRATGRGVADAWGEVGASSGLAILLGALVGIAALVVLALSPSLALARAAGFAAFGVGVSLLLTLTLAPAVLALGDRSDATLQRGRRESHAPSRLMPPIAVGVSRGRWFVAAALILLASVALSGAMAIPEDARIDPPRSWAATDPLRVENDKAIEGFYAAGSPDIKANVLVFEGDLTQPAAHAYIRAVSDTLRQGAQNRSSHVVADTLRDLPFVLDTWVHVHDGAGGLVQNQVIPGAAPTPRTDAYPQTQAEIKADLDAASASPLGPLGALIVDHGYDTAVTIFSVKGGTPADDAAATREVQAALAKNAAQKPADLRVSYVGQSAAERQLAAQQQPWINAMADAAAITAVAGALLLTRSLRVTLAVLALVAIAGVVWLAALPYAGVGLSIALALPVVVLGAVGTAHVAHLALRAKRSGDTRGAYEGAGKGVLYGFVIVAASFLVLTRVSDVEARRAMLATAVALAVAFVVAVLVVPVVYPARREPRDEERHRNVPVVETRAEAKTQERRA